MIVKIWGARGSIPSPIRPEQIREKIVSAMLNISQIEDGEFREELISTIAAEPRATDDSVGPETDGPASEAQDTRRKSVAAYLDSLSPLLSGTAGGNTPCVEVRAGKDLFIIDAGSGIRELGLELMKGECGQGRGVIHLLFSHPHWDHIQGFPFFRPAYIPGNKILIYGVHDVEAALRRQQEFINFPVSLDYMQAEMTFIQLNTDEVLEFGDLQIQIAKNDHPGDAYSFRFKKGNKVFVYASDAAYRAGTELRPWLNFFAEADVLIFDAQFTQRESDEKEDWGHSSSLVGVEMAQQAKAKHLVLFHYDPSYSDNDLGKILADTLTFQQAQYPDRDPVEISVAQEGQTFDLTSIHPPQLHHVSGGEVAILKPDGVIDERVVAELKEQVIEANRSDWPPQLIIDMSQVEMLQVSGLRALVKLRKEQPGTVVVLAGPTSNVRQVIELTGYLDFFAIYPSVQAALKTLEAHESLYLPDQVIKDRYQIEAKIGDGRLGTVFKAIDTKLKQPVAIKILSPSFSEGAIEKFLQQGREIIDLIHPNIVDIYDCDQDGELSFMAEEFIEGKTLRDMMEEYPGRPLPFDIALSIAENIARGLEYAHSHGVIHGDLKPKNVLLADNVKISDFGLGRLESGKSLLNLDVPLTLVTAHYLAPEQILGQPIDDRTDLYALGVILYELFTAQRPFDGTDQEVLEHHLSSHPTPPRQLNRALPYSLAHVILKLMDKDPSKRYATAQQIRRLLASMVTITSGEIQRHNFTRQQWPPLVDRAKPLKRLTNLLEQTRQRRGQLVFITGEAGVGKTRLTRELVQQADDVTVLIGQCRKLAGSRAFQPFVEALRSYFANVFPPDGMATDPTIEIADNPVIKLLVQLAQRIPEIRHVLPNIVQNKNVEAWRVQASHLADSETPSRGFISLAKSLAKITVERPWLLILDDLQWIDQSSLKLLHYLAHRCANLRLMIVGVYRESEQKDNELLAEFLESSNQHLNPILIRLKHLTESQVRVLLEGIWSPTVPDDLVADIYSRTKGNPFYIEEIAKGLIDEDLVSRRNGEWHFVGVEEMRLPERIRNAVLRRTNLLTKETRTLLNQAAILGPAVKFTDLHEMSDLSEWDALESLDIALERELIRHAPSEKLFRFSHTEIQEVLYKNLSPLKRQVMHLEAGEALERRHLREPKFFAEELAYHFFQAGELEKGLIYSIQTATQANSVYANQNALYWYSQAIDALGQLGIDRSATQQQQFELLLAREQVYGNVGDRGGQAADLKTLQSLAQLLHDPIKQAMIHNRQASYERVAGQLTKAIASAEAGLAAARQANDPVLQGQSLVQMAYVATDQGQLDAAREHLISARKIFHEINNQEGEAQCLNGLGVICRYLGDYPQAESYCQRGLAINQGIGNWRGQATSLHNIGVLDGDAGKYGNAVAIFQQTLEISRFIDDQLHEAMCLNSLAATYQELGHWELAQNHLEVALSIRERTKDEQGKAQDLRVLSAIQLAQGEYVAARDHAGEALEISQRLGIRVEEGHTWLELGLALEALGEHAKARTAYAQARTIQEVVGNKATNVQAQAGLARCLLADGQIGEAQNEVEASLAWVDSHGIRGVKYPIHLYLTAYWVLQAANKNKEALIALQEGYALLQMRASDLGDSDLRRMFEENVPENKELLTHLKLQVEQDTVG